MNEIQIFNNPEFGEIRTVMIDGEAWLVGKDVAGALGYADTNKAIAMHVDEEDKLNDKTALSLGQRGGWLINESGLYSLVLSSKLPNAKKFKRWVTSVVLPAIRKTGSYSLVKPDSYMIDDPVERAKRWIEEQEASKAVIAEQARQIEEAQPAIGFTKFATQSKDSCLIRTFAHRLPKEGIMLGERLLYQWMVDNGILSRKTWPSKDGKSRYSYSIYQAHANSGYFEVIERPIPTTAGKPPKMRTTIYLTVKGQVWLLTKLKKEFSQQGTLGLAN